MKLSRTATRRPIGTSIIFVAIALFGFVSLEQLAVDLLPSVDMPRISITTAYEGVAPEEIETLITRPIEQRLSSIEGVDQIEATSAEGLSRVQLQFDWGTDLETALDDVRAAIDRVRSQLPEDAETPTVYKFDLAAAPVAFIGVTGSGDPRQLKHLAEDTLARRIERVPGVASADVRGGRDREIRIELDAERLSALGITSEQIAQAVQRENRDVSAGDMLDVGREVVIRTAGEYENVADIEAVVVTSRDGMPVRVRDLARVVDTYRELNSELWIDGELGIRVMVYKQSGANTVEVVEELREEIERVNRDYRGNVSLEVLWDSSSFIRSAVTNVQSSALVGAALAIAVLLLFLGDLRATAVVATSIPLSVLATFGLMYFWGITLNVISFGGLALGIGLLVDAAIVILENIHHKREEGHGSEEAAVRGAGEVGPAVLAGTLTTLAVFVPVVFVGGFEGVFFGEMAIVVSFALACSLAVALTLVPMLAARLLARRRPGDRPNLSQRMFLRVERWYERFVRGALTSPALVVLLATALLATSVLLVPWIGFELMPETDEGRLDVDVELPIGTPLEETMRTMRDIEARVATAIRPEELEHFITTAGPEAWWRPGGSNEGEVDVMVVPPSERERSIAEIEKDVRTAVEGIPGARIRIRQRSSNMLMRFMRGGGEDRVSVEIRGHELDVADALTQRVVDAVTDVPGVTHARSDRELGQLERVLVVDRGRASELGLGSADVAAAVEHYVLGRVATRLREHGDEYDVRIVLSPDDRRHLEQLPELPVLTPDGRRVPLSSLVEVVERRGPSSIGRLDQERIVRVDVGVAGRPLDEVAGDLAATIGRIETPEGFDIALGGELAEQDEAFSNLLLGIVLAIFLVFTVMAVQFESIKQPLVVMVSVPFAFIGVVLALVTTGTTFNMNSFLGAIVLVGIVVNNAIVMIDYANALRREEGMEPIAAIVAASTRRLRPILMTTATTVLAMLPLALATTEGSEIQAPLARVVVGGLLTSTLVTLIVIPCVYALAERRRVRAREPVAQGAPAE